MSKSTKTTKAKSIVKDWRETLLNEDLHNNDYFFEVTMIVESSRHAFPTIDNIIYNARASEDVIPITKDDIIGFLINLNQIDSKKQACLSFGLLKSANAELNINELSSESLAALIKMRILSYKEDFIANRELMAKLRKQMEDELKKVANPKAGKAKPKKDKKGKEVKDLGDVYEKLHKGIDPDEIANQTKEADLFRESLIQPDPNITTYFVLCQIYDLTVIEELSKIGVDVNLFVEIGHDYIYTTGNDESDASMNNMEEDVNNFWETWTCDSCEITELLPQHTCYLEFVDTGALTAAENFEDFKRILYNIDDFRRQYKNYYNNVRFINVKESKRPANLDCMKIYNALLNQMPNECITIPFILDSLVEEVAVRVDKSSPPDIVNEVPKIIRKSHGGPTLQMEYLFKKYDKKLRNIQPPVKLPKTINLIYGNVLEYVIGNIRPSKSVNDITLDSLKRFPPVNLFEMYQNSNPSDVLLYNYLFCKWSDKLENTTAKELKQCVYSFLFTRKHFNSLNVKCNRIPPNNSIKSLMFVENKPYNENFVGRDPKVNLNPLERIPVPPIQAKLVSSFCSCMNISPDNCSCYDLPGDYCNMVEEFDSSALTQILTTVNNEFKHFDYKYFAPNDVILIRFHHNTNLNKIRTEKCINSLRSVICFRDFCAFILTGDTDWFVDKEQVYWEEKKAEDKRILEERKKEFIEQIKCPGDYVIEGSIKDIKRKEEEAAMKKGKKGKDRDKTSNKDKGGKGKPGSKLSQMKSPERNVTRTSEPCIPKIFPPYDPISPFPFEIYNLGSSLLRSLDDITEFHSVDGISISIHKQRWSRKETSCSFSISANNNSLVLHNTLKNILIADNPFQFHVHIANGIVMVFSKPTIEENIKSKHVITDTVQKKDHIDTIFSKSIHSTKTMSSTKHSSMTNNTLEYLKAAIQNQIPMFKIISSRLHKYQYVKRIKSHIVFPVGKVLKRVLCKPTLFLRMKKRKSAQESKCIPYTDLINDKRTEINMEWKATLPTGLLVQTVPSIHPYPFYVKQKYIIHRSDLKGIKDESYRCFLRNGTVMKFLKDGSIKTFTPDKNICHYKYGCFSSNTRKKPSVDELLNSLNKKKESNIVPLHFYVNNLTRLQKRVRKMCNRFKTHLIDVADNYRFESSRDECRKLHKVYKLSKKIYTNNTCMIPILNYTVITSSGRIVDVKNNIVYDHEKRYRQMEYTDYLLSETLIHREDGTSWMINTNGRAVTQFADGTRITTWPTELENNYILLETPSSLSSRDSTLPSTEKICQVEENNTFLNNEIELTIFDPVYQDDSVDELSLLYAANSKTENEGYVIFGMNYMYEHPNYATVTYYCTDDITNITMPDNIQVTADKDGAYVVNMLNNDSINVNDKNVEFKASISKTCDYGNKTCCKLNIEPLISGDTEEENNFLYMKDSSRRIFKVNFSGDITNYLEDEDLLNNTEINLCSLNNNSTNVNERYFVVKRDLSGLELYHESIPYHFVHTLHNKDFHSKGEEGAILLEESSCTTVIQPLRKTYSEHLMMLYDLPVLATTNETRCMEKLWKLHDLDINSIIMKRNPLYTFKRLINRLPVSIMEGLATSLAKCLSDGTYNEPDITIVERLPQTEPELPAPVILTKPQKEIPLKSKTVKKLCAEYKKLIEAAEIPQYFDTLKGVCFTTLEECSEEAMEHSFGAPWHPRVLPEDDNGDQLDITEYPGILKVPQELTIHLKPDSYTHDIELSPTGIRVITENYTKEYPFPKYYESSLRSKSEGYGGLYSIEEETESTDLEKQTEERKLDLERKKLKDGSFGRSSKEERKSNFERKTINKGSLNLEKQREQRKSDLERKTTKKGSLNLEKQKEQRKSDLERTTIKKGSLNLEKQKEQRKSDLKRTTIKKESLNLEKKKEQRKSDLERKKLKEGSFGRTSKDYPTSYEHFDGKEEEEEEEEEAQIITDCDHHTAQYAPCTYDTCMCLHPSEKERRKKSKKMCTCKSAICSCSKTRRSNSSLTSGCSMMGAMPIDFNINNLAVTILEYLETSPIKLKILEDNIDTIIETVTKALEITDEDKQNLIESLIWSLPYYNERSKLQKLNKDEILKILHHLKSVLTYTSSNERDKYSSFELSVIASSIDMAITESRTTKSKIELHVKTKLNNSNLTPREMNEVLDLVIQKIKLKSFSYNDVQYKVPKKYQKIVDLINSTIESPDFFKNSCNVCHPQKKSEIFRSANTTKDGITTIFCKNLKCSSKKHRTNKQKEPSVAKMGQKIVIVPNAEKPSKLSKQKSLESFGTKKARIQKTAKGAMKKEVEKVVEEDVDDDTTSDTLEEVIEPMITKRVVVWNSPKPNIYDANYNRKINTTPMSENV